jgi:hypothetical protein
MRDYYVSSNDTAVTNKVSMIFWEKTSTEGYSYKYVGNNTTKNQFVFRREEKYDTTVEIGTIALEKSNLVWLNTAPNYNNFKPVIKANYVEITTTVDGSSISTFNDSERYEGYTSPQVSVTDNKVEVTWEIETEKKRTYWEGEYISKTITTYLTDAEFYINAKSVSYEKTKLEYRKEAVMDVSPEGVWKNPENELISLQNTVSSSSAKQQLTSDNLHYVMRSYGDGKEVYTLKCSVMDEPFAKYDIVEPYIFTSKGEVPLSTKEDGTAKQFEVIGVDISYSGVVWQEITIQEYYE